MVHLAHTGHVMRDTKNGNFSIQMMFLLLLHLAVWTLPLQHLFSLFTLHHANPLCALCRRGVMKGTFMASLDTRFFIDVNAGKVWRNWLLHHIKPCTIRRKCQVKYWFEITFVPVNCSNCSKLNSYICTPMSCILTKCGNKSMTLQRQDPKIIQKNGNSVFP